MFPLMGNCFFKSTNCVREKDTLGGNHEDFHMGYKIKIML